MGSWRSLNLRSVRLGSADLSEPLGAGGIRIRGHWFAAVLWNIFSRCRGGTDTGLSNFCFYLWIKQAPDDACFSMLYCANTCKYLHSCRSSPYFIEIVVVGRGEPQIIFITLNLIFISILFSVFPKCIFNFNSFFHKVIYLFFSHVCIYLFI